MKILVVHPSNAELNALTEELIRRKLLQKCVHSYVSGTGWIEKSAKGLPIFGTSISKLLARRSRFNAVDTALFVQPVRVLDALRTIASRAPLPAQLKQRLVDTIIYTRNRAMGRSAATLVSHETSAVIAAYGMALEPFVAATRFGAVRVLDFPITHFRFTEQVMQEEARLQPNFANTLQHVSEAPHWVEVYEQEFQLADCILVGSNFVRDSFIAQGISQDKLVVIPYGFQVDDFTPAPAEPATFNVLFVGQIGQRKGISYLLEAYSQFKKADSKLTLVGNFVGDASVFERYAELFDHVPHVPPTEMPGVFRTGSVFAFPSLIEGLPLAVIEAMASGLPCIVTNRGAGELVRDNIDGFVIDMRRVDQLVEKLEHLYRDCKLRRRMSVSARQRAESFTWEVYADNVIKFIDEAVGNRSSPFKQ